MQRIMTVLRRNNKKSYFNGECPQHSKIQGAQEQIKNYDLHTQPNLKLYHLY